MGDTHSDHDASADRHSEHPDASRESTVSSPSTADSLALVDVTKHYGDTTALEDLSVAIHPGTFHGLIGPNGSGKTTLFAILAGLTRLSSGRFTVPEDATVGYSFQEPRFYPALTVRENLEAFRGFADDPPPDSWLETLLEELRLEPVTDRRADELSGGFRTKLDLALALVKRPQFLLLDEPLADVDDDSRRRISGFLEAYQTADRTVVVSTHNVTSFAEQFDRLTVVVDGELRYDGSPDTDVVAQYRSVLEDAA